MSMIEEVIVVEGKDDECRIKEAIDCEVIITKGFNITRDLLKKLRIVQKKRGIIVFTDPDYTGEKIRAIINRNVSNVKNAYLTQDEASKNGDIGIENAKNEDIINALKNAKMKIRSKRNEFTKKDLLNSKLIINELSKERRIKLGKILGIGYSNGKKLLDRLNNYGITREEFEKAVEKLNDR